MVPPPVKPLILAAIPRLWQRLLSCGKGGLSQVNRCHRIRLRRAASAASCYGSAHCVAARPPASFGQEAHPMATDPSEQDQASARASLRRAATEVAARGG